jgi:4-amino-4-deoxy-L-arabinose transferase-like glycosyltransferase
MACGVLTKGPIALVLPLLVAAPFAAWRRTWRALADPVAVLLFIAVLSPWLLAVRRHVPDILEYALITETASRMFTDQLQRNGPIWYFLPLLPAAALPWSVVAAAGLRRVGSNRDPDGRRDGRFVYLMLWLLLPLAFFSLSHSKRPQYVLPLIPAIGLIVGGAWTLHPKRLPGCRIGAITLGLLAVLLLAAHRLIPTIVSATPAIASAIPRTATWLGIACGAGCLMAWLGRGRRRVALIGLALPVAAIPFSSRRLMDEIGRERSSFEISSAIEPHLTAATQVVAVSVYPLSLPFYLRRTLVLSTADGTELTSNYLTSRFAAWVNRTATLKSADWWREAAVTCERPRVFVFDSQNWPARQFVDRQLALLADNGKFAAYGPCGVTNLAQAGR